MLRRRIRIHWSSLSGTFRTPPRKYFPHPRVIRLTRLMMVCRSCPLLRLVFARTLALSFRTLFSRGHL